MNVRSIGDRHSPSGLGADGWAAGCRTSIAQPRSRRSPDQLGSPVLRSPESGTRGPAHRALGGAPVGSSASAGPRRAPSRRPRGVAPPGSPRTPGAGKSPRKRARRPQGPTGPAARGRPAPRRPSAVSATSASASACCRSKVGESATGPCPAATARPCWYKVSRAASSAPTSTAPASGLSRPRTTSIPSSSAWTCSVRARWRALPVKWKLRRAPRTDTRGPSRSADAAPLDRLSRRPHDRR
jgi:hypothetical protein